MRVDRGLDPAWASNPGRDRERILADRLIGTLDAADEALARAAVEQVAGSPLLERQLSPMKRDDPPRGDLPVAHFRPDPDWERHWKARTRIVRLTAGTARKQRRKHRDIEVSDFRRLLPKALDEAQVVTYQDRHWGRPVENLVFFLHSGGEIFRAVIRKESDRFVRLATLHRVRPENVETAVREGIVLRDTRERGAPGGG